jgi:hypothetical protein
MLACNDMSVANQSLAEWKEEQPPRRKSRAWGAKLYFVRTQFWHLYEGLDVVKAIAADESLRNFIDQCDAQTQRSFAALLTYLFEVDH